ncbi:MAG: FRG domain-containing protein [Oscillospiraceae bacterium]|nr:FRG domain-containing protein [Oscillospiraceae bacterium]
MEQANSIDSFIKILGKYENGAEQYYRGQLEKYTTISPSIARDSGYAENESKIYHEAVSLGATELEGLTSPLEKLSKLQHYGIPTRLVDVTIDPLIALYFAVENENDPSPGNVYLYQVKGYPPDSNEVRVLSLLPTIDSLSIDNIAREFGKEFGGSVTNDDILSIVDSPVIMQRSDVLQKSNPRLHQQKGTFLLCGNKVNGEIITNSLKSLDTYTPTLVIRIPFEYKRAVKEELDTKYGINLTSVYPELPSVAQYIKEKYKKGNTSLDGTYSIVKEEDTSIGVAKRISVIIVLNQQLTIEQIKNISISVMQHYQKNQNVVWLYVARTGDDYITYNWLLRAQWVDPKLKPEFRPMTLKCEEQGYYWDYNESYSTRADIYSQIVFSEDCKLYAEHKRIWDQFLQVYSHLINAFSVGSWSKFIEEVHKEQKYIGKLYLQLSNFGHSHDKEFDDFLGTISIIVGIVNDFHFLIENGNDKGTQYMISKKFVEVSDRIEQVNQGFSKWATKAG